jgi:spore coat protein H
MLREGLKIAVHTRLLAGTWSQRTRSACRSLFIASALHLSACGQDLGERADPSTEPPPPLAAGPCAVQPDEDLSLELPTWDLQISQAAWDKLHEDVNADVEVPAALCAQGESYEIELELQGSSTRKLPKKSFDLKWKRGAELRAWPYDDAVPSEPVAIRKLFLKAMAKDQSLIREALGFDLYRALGYATPHTGFVNLRINGAYWGLYATIEPVNEAYIAARGYPEGGRLYKAVRKHGSRADFAPGRDLTKAFETALATNGGPELDDADEPADLPNGEEPDETPEAFEPETMQEGAPKSDKGDEEAENLPDEYAALERLVTRLQHTALEEGAFEVQVDPIFSLVAYFDRMLWVAFTQNGDAIAQNFYLYHAGAQEAEHWYQLPWDSDISFAANYRDVDSVIDIAAAPLVDGGNYFSRRMLEVSGLRSRYTERFLGVLDEQLLEAEGFSRLVSYRERLTNDLAHDQARWKRATEPHTAFDRIEAFLGERGAALRQALAGL